MPFKDYRRTSGYGMRNHPDGSGRKFHAGLDMVKLKGGVNAPIEAFVPGQVVYARYAQDGIGLGSFFGNLVVVKDKNGALHLYAHLNSISVKKGQTIAKGQKVGNQGETGNAFGAHLHYEVRPKSEPKFGWVQDPAKRTVNPETYLKNYKGSDRVVQKLVVDGSRGPATIRRWQQFLGTTVDGKLSKTSQAIRAWQTLLNKYAGAKLTVDGKEGPATIRATQKFFGTPQDGKISKVSLMVKELQKFLNSYGQ